MIHVNALEPNPGLSDFIPQSQSQFIAPSCFAFLLENKTAAQSYEIDFKWTPSIVSTPFLPEENIFDEMAFAFSYKQNTVFRLNDFGIPGHLLVEKDS
jgi:hypothetical protein